MKITIQQIYSKLFTRIIKVRGDNKNNDAQHFWKDLIKKCNNALQNNYQSECKENYQNNKK